MPVHAALTELERLAAERDGLVAWLASQFTETLSVDDVEDLVADALPVLAADPRLPSGGRRRRHYLRRALEHDALDELRRRYGRDLRHGPREFVALREAEALADIGAAPESRLEAAQTLAQRQAAAASALERMRPEDAQVLRLKYLEQRAPDEIAAALGVSRTQYERRLTRASQHGLDALSRAQPGPACGPVRQLLGAGTRHGRHDAARIDVHLLDCLHCRAFARARGLLEAFGLPLLGAWERLAARVGALVGRGGGPGVARDAHEAALAGGGAALGAGALSAGLGAKLAVGCAGVTLAAVCVGPLANQFAPTPPDQSQSAESERPPRRASAPAATATARPTITIVAATPTATATATETATAAPTRQSKRPRPSARERRRRDRAAAAREFGPESAAPQVNNTAKASAASAAATEPASAPPPPPPPPPAPAKAPPRSSSFSEEFRP